LFTARDLKNSHGSTRKKGKLKRHRGDKVILFQYEGKDFLIIYARKAKQVQSKLNKFLKR
jgi:hypothetical protein